MRVVFHIISTGGGAGGSRTTRYISERDKDPTREGPGARPLFNEDRSDLTYRKADRILDPVSGQPEKDDLIHLSVSFQEEDFTNLGGDEKERQTRLRQVIRDGMRGMAEELNVERLTWVAGIHRNSDNPHAHVVISKDAREKGTGREMRIGRIRKTLLPHREIQAGKPVLVPGTIGNRFLAALEKHQAIYQQQENDRTQAHAAWEEFTERMQQQRSERIRPGERDNRLANAQRSRPQMDYRSIAASWNASNPDRQDGNQDFRVALGKRFVLSTRLAFTQVWHDRAVEHGETYRFSVLDQSTAEERQISEFDVRRRAVARATRISQGNPILRNQAIEEDLSQHGETLRQLEEIREAKIAALRKDISGMSQKLSRVETAVIERWDGSNDVNRTPLIDRQTLSELQQQAVKLNLTHLVSEMESIRTALAREHNAPVRTDDEAAKLGAQLNVARADLMAKDARLENFEASVHLGTYEVHDERWSLGALDKQIGRRIEDSKFVPTRAQRLDFRSLAYFNYSSEGRQQAHDEVEHLNFVRAEIVRRISGRREGLTEDRDTAREMVDVLEGIHQIEQDKGMREGQVMPDPQYDAFQIRSLETSAEILRDSKLLREVHEWENTFGRNSEPGWEGRSVAREIMSGLAVEETKERLERYLETKRVASLNLGNHQTGTLREVEARTLTEYMARAIESREQRDFRHAVKVAAKDHHGRLVSDFEKAQDYHEAVRELASELRDREPRFTDKEKINLEIYAERQNDEMTRQQYLGLARTETREDREVSASLSR
jgi:hypothetical protein